MRTLQQLAVDESQQFPLAAPIVMSDVYMDDILSGSETLSGAKELQRELSEIFKKGGMNLHKWCSNNNELNNSSKSDYTFLSHEDAKTLGVYWNPQNDHFSFKIMLETVTVHTKRTVLSSIARIFDPLGLLGPIITKSKIFIQSLWLLKIDWNEPLPAETQREWQQFLQSLHSINDIKIERCIIIEDATTIELHGFADSSEVAYGAVIYAKSLNSNEEVKIRMIASKSRVAPIKKITVPRLELCAAVLLAKLMKRVRDALKMSITSLHYWSDSTIVLAWLTKEPHHLKTFVANRVTKIQAISDVQQWRHVPSEENPADILSRGTYPDKLNRCELWWTGPKFLAMSEYPKKDIPVAVILKNFPNELKNISNENTIMTLNISNNTFISEFLNLSSSYFKLVRIFSFIFRFLRKTKYKEVLQGNLKSNEVGKAERVLIRLVQKQVYMRELENLTKTGTVSNKSQVSSLNPFIDEEGLLRVGGRLRYGNLNYNKKFPVLLPSNHRLSEIIAEYYHVKYLHCGPNSLLYHLREKFWIVQGRNLCRKIVRRCVICFRANPKSAQQLMGNLPRDRIVQNCPFNISGVDFCGPFFIKYKNQRKGIFNKIYVCIFICFVTKAIHMEIVTDMTSAAFIAALKRFMSRRGRCSKLYTDNAKTFVGAQAELSKLHKLVTDPDTNLSGYFAQESIQWNFIPPRSPNFGGLWEAGVKAFKYHFKRSVGDAKLTFEEFLTVMNQIEGILNSRPISPLTSDIDDLDVLTPAHFLIGRSILSTPEPDLTGLSDNRLSLWQKTTKLVQTIWKKWSHAYLSNLQSRSKWMFEKDNVKLGALVVLKEDDVPVQKWLLGRVVGIFPGADGRIRVCDIKTKQGTFRRGISKICILPLEDNNI